jgi:Zn-dependent protease with chaperone function
MAMRTLADNPTWPGIRQLALPLLLLCAECLEAAQPAPAAWFPDSPTFRHYDWADPPCPGCSALAPSSTWTRMAELAGLPLVRFRAAPDESGGQAYSLASRVVVLSPSALQLERCQLAFLIGHELVHIAQRHFDEDAIALSVFSGKPAHWTRRGEEAMRLMDGNFGLALRLSAQWQAQEFEADWIGSLLAAQACGCSVEAGALAYFGGDGDSGGGIAAAHAPDAERVRRLLPFAESAQRLSERALQ